MLLAIDVGNTDTKLGFFDDARGGTGALLLDWRVTTERRRTADEFGALFIALFASANVRARPTSRAIAISSVVPQNDRALRRSLPTILPAASRRSSAPRRRISWKSARSGRANSAATCAASAIGARALYGAPLIVVGFGTATTFGAVSRDGAFLGAAIAPGIQISIDALVARTAKLPQVALEAPHARDRPRHGRGAAVRHRLRLRRSDRGARRAHARANRRSTRASSRPAASPRSSRARRAAIDAVEPHLVLEGLRLSTEAPSRRPARQPP